ncbi:hypothetical protein M422DRAFT_54307 [Sphaerobolus stellatus SS14]|uniref:G domain-containing protein n=1 Tax=Sphaerobolus stellatus (strain SS14) TaxID=990650 RepID=A0A0C9UV46_SPHS4|nr:hypothetical protein M422DRAFT_54307 [Sphaerobolus stellatus SS14]
MPRSAAFPSADYPRSAFSPSASCTTLVTEGVDIGPNPANDEVFEDDIVFLLMGPTGSGKTSFIKTATGDPRVVVHDGLQPAVNSRLQVFRCAHPEDKFLKFVFVDTPGFKDELTFHNEMLRCLESWLKETFQKKIRVMGVLYFHSISDNRVSHAMLRNLILLKKICGERTWNCTTFVTTRWDEADDKFAEARFLDLSRNHWKEMLAHGAMARRFSRDYFQAWEILHLSIDRAHSSPLLLQTEELERRLSSEPTGNVVRDWLNDHVKRAKRGRSNPSNAHSPASSPLNPVSAVDSVFINATMETLVLSLRAAGPFLPGAQVAYILVSFIWDKIKSMRAVQQSLVGLVRDATYLMAAVVEQSNNGGISNAMSQIMESFISKLQEVKMLLEQAIQRQDSLRAFLAGEETIVRQCHDDIRSAINVFHLEATVLMHVEVRRLRMELERSRSQVAK